tara:strand:+ start:15113 stop:15862 length:750 start_codon:yes stop_codon:yes gene_type:complete
MAKGNFLYLTEQQMDAHIYRIMKEKYVVSLFKDRENVLVQPGRWKDKFENFQLSLGGTLDGEKFEYTFRDDFVGQCWTSEYLSEAMWGIYANDPAQRFLRIRSTPRRLLKALEKAHPEMPQDTCFVGKVQYETTNKIKQFQAAGGTLQISPLRFAQSLLIKRKAFKHENEVRLLFFGDAKNCDQKGCYRYQVDPHEMITQIMADPNRDRKAWKADKAEIVARTGFKGPIKRSKIYDAPDWNGPNYTSPA